MKVYLAGPFFNDLERNTISKVIHILKSKNLELFIPMEHKIPGGEDMPNDEWGRRVFEMDRDAIYDSDIIVSIYYGLYSDSGTAWELGFARALNKKIVVLHVDYSGPASLMINNSADYNIFGFDDLNKFDFENLDNNKFSVNIEQK